MDRLEQQDLCQLIEGRMFDEFQEFLSNSGQGLRVMAEPYGEASTDVLKPDAGDFAKWMRATYPDLPVQVPQARKLLLRSSEVWLPLVLLASDVTLVMYLNIVSNYMYDRLKGVLGREKTRVHLSVEYFDGESGSLKRFEFSGDHESLKVVIQKLSLNQMFDD